jgi:hypothetical protein
MSTGPYRRAPGPVPPARQPRPVGRRGVTIVIVMGLLAITLALSYTMVRTQLTRAQIEANASSHAAARQAALSGLSAALRSMCTSSWPGVGTAVTRQLDARQSYSVQFLAGDAQLLPGDDDYDRLPYRVTGYAASGVGAVPAEHQVQAVAQLIPRRLSSEPSRWVSLQACDVMQWSGNDVDLNLPVRLAGQVQLQGRVRLCHDYPGDTAARDRYLSDLEAIRAAGGADHRPFTGPVQLTTLTSDSTRSLIAVNLNAPVTTVSRNTTAPATHPGNVTSYRLYAGGPAYAIPALSSTLAGVALGPDPAANPLGVVRVPVGAQLGDDVTIRGTLIAGSGHLSVQGVNVRLESIPLPAMHGDSRSHRLPTALVQQDLRLGERSQGSITGMAMVWGTCRVEGSEPQVDFQIMGRLWTRVLDVEGRSNWSNPVESWTNALAGFLAQLAAPGTELAIPHFPLYMQAAAGLDPRPVFSVQPKAGVVAYHWQDWNQPVFVPHPSDGGLLWDVVRLELDP